MPKSYKGYTFEKFFNDKIRSEKDNKYKEIYENLKRAYEQIREIIKKELVFTHSIFSLYSSHAADHSEKIISTIERLLENHWKNITVTDAWMFLCCAYIHDMGMCVTDAELWKDMQTEKFKRFLKDLTCHPDDRLRIAAQNLSFELKKEVLLEEQSFFKWISRIPRESMLVAAEYYRPKHAKRVEEKLKKTKVLETILLLNGGIKTNIISMIAKICTMHGADFEQLLNKLSLTDSIFNIPYHPRFVAVLLRLGDLCDLDCDRFSEDWIKAAGGLTKTNLIHYYKHQSVKPTDISAEKIFIQVEINFEQICKEISGEEGFQNEDLIEKGLQIVYPNEQHDFCNRIVLETKNWFQWIEEELKNMKLNWKKITNNEIPLLEPEYQCEVFVNGEKPIFENKNMRFIFSKEKAYNLIEGYNLYDDQLIFVRELIQNSLDALKIKFWHDLRDGRHFNDIEEEIGNRLLQKDGNIDYSDLQPFDFKNTNIYDDYKVIVKVEHNEGEEEAKFIIEDNGIGISIENLKNKIMNTGTSHYNEQSQKDMEGMPKWLQPTGAFGIGLHSVFALSDSIYIYTRTENGEEQEITLHSGKKDGNIFVSKCKKEKKLCKRYATGTHIEVILDMKRYKSKSRSRNNAQDDSIFIPGEEIFIDRPESNLCFAIETQIKDLLIHPLFKIEYTCGEHINVCENFSQLSKYCLLFNKDRRNKLCDEFYKDNRKDYEFVLDNFGRDIIIWLRKGMVFYFCFDEYDDTIDRKICCKGIKIKNAEVENILPWIKLKEIDIFSGNSNDILIASRNELKEEYKNKIIKILEKVNQEIAEIYSRLLLELEKKEEVIQWGEDLKEIENLYKKKEKNYSKEAIVKLAEEYKNKKKGDSEKGVSVYILEQIIFCVLNQEAEEIKKIIKQEKKITTKELGKKVKKKIKEESYLIELMINFINIFKNMFGSEFRYEFGKVFGSEFGSEFRDEFGREFRSEIASEIGSELKKALAKVFRYEFGKVFGSEFGSKFGSEFEHEFGSTFKSELEADLESEFGSEFGSALRSAFRIDFGIEFIHIFGRDLQRIFINMKGILNQPYLKKNSLNFITILPFYSIIWLIYTTKAYHNISILQGILKNKVFSNATGYNFGYYFIGKKDIGEILTSKTLEIYEKDFYYTAQKLPFISYIPCNSLLIEEDNKLMLNFDMTNLETRAIEIETIFVLKCYLEEYLGTILIHSFKSYEKIAIKGDFNNNNDLFSKKNYGMVLWQEFQEIKEYLLSLKEEKQDVIDDLMNYKGEEGNRVKQAINYTYHHRAYINENETYQQTMEGIRKTYKQFISDVLDCILLSDEELKEIRYQNREITL